TSALRSPKGFWQQCRATNRPIHDKWSAKSFRWIWSLGIATHPSPRIGWTNLAIVATAIAGMQARLQCDPCERGLMRDIRLSSLRICLEVLRRQNLTAVAQALNMTQSAV